MPCLNKDLTTINEIFFTFKDFQNYRGQAQDTMSWRNIITIQILIQILMTSSNPPPPHKFAVCEGGADQVLGTSFEFLTIFSYFFNFYERETNYYFLLLLCLLW